MQKCERRQLEETTVKHILYGGNKMEKKIIKIVVKVWIIIMFVVIGCRGYYLSIVKKPLKNINGTEIVAINSGDTVKTVINRLNKEGKIKNSWLIRLYMKLNPADISIKKSEININADMSFDELLLAIDQAEPSADSGVARVTIPEGKNIEEIGAILEDKGVISKKDFIDSCQKYELPSYIKKDSDRKYALEGFLFPDTYDFVKGSTGNTVIRVMLRNFENRIEEVRRSSSNELKDEDIDKIITLASMIEEEVQVAEERTLVSSVFANRLKIGMPLQSDPTVQYSLGEHKEKLTLNDYKIDSPYNTYVVQGLPIGPISNPGKASIEAALNPAQTNYLYFCARNDGSHEFNVTLEKHNEAVRKYQSN